MKYSILILSCIVVLFSCKEKENMVDPDLIIGEWRLQQVTFNDIDGAEINDWVSSSTILSIHDDNTYYRNYVSGEWTFENQALVLVPNESLTMPNWEYEVLLLNDGILEVKIFLTEGGYCCSFDEFEENEILTITESYYRVE